MDGKERDVDNQDNYDTFDLEDIHGLIFEYYRLNPDQNVRCIPPKNRLKKDGSWRNDDEDSGDSDSDDEPVQPKKKRSRTKKV